MMYLPGSIVVIVINHQHHFFHATCSPAKDFPAKSLIYRAIAESVFNQLVGSPLLIAVVVWPIAQWRDIALDTAFPAFTTTLRDVACFIFIEDTMFYWLHRLLHHPAIYKYIHKVG